MTTGHSTILHCQKSLTESSEHNCYFRYSTQLYPWWEGPNARSAASWTERRAAGGLHSMQTAGRAEKPHIRPFSHNTDNSPRPGVTALQLLSSPASTSTAAQEQAGLGRTAARLWAEAEAWWPAVPMLACSRAREAGSCWDRWSRAARSQAGSTRQQLLRRRATSPMSKANSSQPAAGEAW